MPNFKNWRRTLLSASLLVTTITAWIFFAPLQFGGSAAYVIISGDSMSPRFVSGDLVIVRAQQAYHEGDAVAYQHPEIGYVFHRIIGVDTEGHFILQGDHNDWVDAYHPLREEVVGRFWLHAPRLGNILETLRSPWGFAILALVFGFLLFRIVVPPEKKRDRRKERGRGNAMSGSKISENLFILAVLALGALILGIAAFRQPLHNEVKAPLSYEQQALFRYTADVPVGIYDSDQVQPGEPIFRRLNGSFSISMDYLFISAHPANVNGSYRLFARVSDDTGWKRTLELVPQTAFSGNVFTISGTLVLNEIQRFIDVLETETGVQRGRYDLSIISEIQVEGMLGGLPLKENFSPGLNFQVDDLEVRLEQKSTSDQSVLNPTNSGALMRISLEENKLGILGLKIPVSLSRWISLGIGIPALFGLAMLLLRMYQSTRDSELERLRVWYGSLLVEARDVQMLEAPGRVEIASMEDLVRLAEQDQRPILHLPDSDLHHFFIQTPEQLYHYGMEEGAHTTEIMAPASSGSIWPSWQLPWSRKNRDLWDAYENALKGWAQAVNKRLYDQGHAERVAELAEKLARRLNIHGRALEEICLAAYVHNIGLMDVPNEIIHKKKKLTKKEWELIRNHPTHAREHLSGTDLMKTVAESVYYHNERWDGSGYPEGLRGEEIPFGARIVSIAAVWDALDNPRPYRPAWSREKICQYLHEQSGTQFDPHITSAFLGLMAELDPEGCVEVIEAQVVTEEE